MMSTPGILIEIIDEPPTGTGPRSAGQEQYYMVSMNGHRHVMNEAQVVQLLEQVRQQENYQQQPFFQQQQQQQRPFSEQQRF